MDKSYENYVRIQEVRGSRRVLGRVFSWKLSDENKFQIQYVTPLDIEAKIRLKIETDSKKYKNDRGTKY